MTHYTHSDYSDRNAPRSLALPQVMQALTQHKTLMFLVLIALTGMVVAPFLQQSLGEIKTVLLGFRSYCLHNQLEGHLLYIGLFTVALFLGLPVSTLLMMLIGLTYGFGDAVLLVMFCRMGVAIGAFLIARHGNVQSYGRQHAPLPFGSIFKRHPAAGLALMRLAPLPDSVVSYGMGKSQISFATYTLVSFICMLPVTLALVWAGKALGSIQHLIGYLA